MARNTTVLSHILTLFKFALLLVIVLPFGSTKLEAAPSDFVVYGVYTGLNMGFANEIPKKDFYVNLGLKHGVRIGTSLEVMRKVATYDAIGKKLYKDMVFPIARIKVIHSEDNASIARMEAMIPEERAPASTPRAILVGDMVRTVR